MATARDPDSAALASGYENGFIAAAVMAAVAFAIAVIAVPSAGPA